MFDKFEPFKQLQHQSFTFQPSRYVVWEGGQTTKSGNTSGLIKAREVQSPVENEVCSLVTINDSELNSEIKTHNYFDIFITANDRLQLLTIPAHGNDTECMGIVMFKNVLGTTRRTKSFLKNEPYCCNLFLQNQTFVKITFAFNAPEKLIEFYP